MCVYYLLAYLAESEMADRSPSSLCSIAIGQPASFVLAAASDMPTAARPATSNVIFLIVPPPIRSTFLVMPSVMQVYGDSSIPFFQNYYKRILDTRTMAKRGIVPVGTQPESSTIAQSSIANGSIPETIPHIQFQIEPSPKWPSHNGSWPGDPGGWTPVFPITARHVVKQDPVLGPKLVCESDSIQAILGYLDFIYVTYVNRTAGVSIAANRGDWSSPVHHGVTKTFTGPVIGATYYVRSLRSAAVVAEACGMSTLAEQLRRNASAAREGMDELTFNQSRQAYWNYQEYDQTNNALPLWLDFIDPDRPSTGSNGAGAPHRPGKL